jgi:cyclase
MTLKCRVIPILLLTKQGLVKGKNFDHSRRVGSPQSLVRVYRARDVDELIMLDVEATLSGSPPSFRDIEMLARECNFPLAVGGGISDRASVETLFEIGADKVVLNTVCYQKAELVTDVAGTFGAQSLVVSIDYRVVNGRPLCFSRSGTHCESVELKDWAIRMSESGAGELVLCNCDRDGMMNGYDLDNLRTVVEAVRIPVVVSGGAGNLSHFAPAILGGGASAVGAGSIFLFTHTTPSDVRDELGRNGIPVRTSVK